MVNIAASAEIKQYIPTRPREGMLFVPPVGVFRMLEIPQWSAAPDNRNDSVVVFRGRRTCRPFQCPRVPWIIARHLASVVGPNQIADQDEGPSGLKEDTDGNDQVEG